MWKPKEIIVREEVKNDAVTAYFLEQCSGFRIKFVNSGNPKEIAKESEILTHAGPGMLDKILAGKQVIYLGPANNSVDLFAIPDDRMVCPHFERLKLASNGCFYRCEWCYLKLTYRAAFPFISVRVEYAKIKGQLNKRLAAAKKSVIFNSGELADSLSMEHLTRAGREFIPWFGQKERGYLFMLTKSDNVENILDLPHNGHTIIAWTMNNALVSKKYELGAPSFEERLKAARMVQEAGYRVRLRIDPIIPFQGWREEYAGTIKRILEELSPESITIGTLRFEEGFYRMRKTIFSKSSDLLRFIEKMGPMFPLSRFLEMTDPNPESIASARLREPRFLILPLTRSENIRIAPLLYARNQ